MNRKNSEHSVSLFMALLALSALLTSTANAETTFSSKDTFAIPEYNSQIRFAVGGSYDRATLEGNTWVFDGLTFDAVNVTGFSVSAKDCNITITGCSGINWVDQIGWVTYNVTGVGSQTFGLSNLTGDGGFVDRYAVFIDGVNRTEGDGWTRILGNMPGSPYSIPSQYFAITGASSNVSIGYTAIYNPAHLEPESASQPPSPTPTASSTPSSGSQPQEQVIYTIALVGAVLAIAVIAFAVKSQLRSRK